MTLNPYLVFNGQCEAAFKFYERCLGGKIDLVKHAGTPAEEHVPPEWRDKIMHARLTREGVVLMGSDAQPNHFRQAAGFSVALHLSNPAETERLFSALSEGGKVTMPLQKTFWSASFGMFVDQFGIPWMVNCEQAV